MRTVHDGWAYIIRLTEQLVGKNVLSALKLDNRGLNARALYLCLELVIAPKVREMSNETLGRICCYGTGNGFHRRCGSSERGFINRTGFHDVLPNDTMGRTTTCGRILLEEIAVAVIVCVARDILMQNRWSRERLADETEEDSYSGAESPSWERS